MSANWQTKWFRQMEITNFIILNGIWVKQKTWKKCGRIKTWQIYTEKGLKLYHKNCKKIIHRLYVDATSCISSEKPNNSTVLQYTMLMDFLKEGKPDFPIAHMISDSHSSRIFVLNFFLSIRYAYQQLRYRFENWTNCHRL